MKKMMAAALVVLMLCLLTGCTKQEEPNGILDAVGAGFETIDQSGDNSVRVAVSETQTTVLKMDLISEMDTLVRPYVFAEPGIDFYKIEHSEANFSSVFGYTMNLIGQMEQSEEHKAAVMLLNQQKLPEGLTKDDIGFMNLGYVPDPQRRCEIIFTGMTNTGEGAPIRDEVYAFCRFGLKNESGATTVINALVTDQNAVYAIAQRVHQTGRLPAGVEAWMLRKLGL